MTALYRDGQQAAALRAFQRARTGLVDQLGVDPGPELQRLERAIIDHDPALLGVDRPPVAQAPTRDHGTTSLTPLPPAMAALTGSPLVGRDTEIGTLRRRWQAAMTGKPGLVFVRGEAGIGKTRLAADLARIAHDDGGLVLHGRCDPDPVAPYQPFAEALATFTNTTPEGSVAQSAPWVTTELARLVPGLANRTSNPRRIPTHLATPPPPDATSSTPWPRSSPTAAANDPSWSTSTTSTGPTPARSLCCGTSCAPPTTSVY
jgi:hypothetical protein